MKKYDEIKATVGTFKSINKTRESHITTKNQRLVVACYEELFKAIQNKDRKACFNFEYSLTKTTDTKLTEARVYDASDNKSLFQLYSKNSGKEYEIVLSKIDKYSKAFSEVLKDISTLSDGKVFKARCTFENVPEVIKRAHVVLACKGNIEDVKKALSPKTEAKSTKK